MDESLASQFSRPGDGLPDNSPLNHPANAVGGAGPATNGMPNSVAILD